ncbi:aldehyde dehydrogenase (NADP(+)) [Pedobacter sp. PWIIR3]
MIRRTFNAINAATGAVLDGEYQCATDSDIRQALEAAEAAHLEYKNISRDKKVEFLNAIADEIESIRESLVKRAGEESGLPAGRLEGEVGRTTGQLRMFANQAAEGSWVNAVIDHAQPDRKPFPRSDIRRMLVPIGPVVVFGASNFPLAFSVAGGDTASALAAGCPVVVKAHPAHPGTSALVGSAISAAVRKVGLPQGVFTLLFDDGHQVGAALVMHPKVKAVTFTGSFKGGMALLNIAQQRATPIPVFAEMGSVNPVVLLPGVLKSKPEQTAVAYAGSITLGAGQFCTNPGLIFAVKSPGLDAFISKLGELIASTPSATMLTSGIHYNYQKLSQEILAEDGVSLITTSDVLNTDLENQSLATVASVPASVFIANPKLQEEIFGPYSLLVIANDMNELEVAIDALGGQLTATIMAEKDELGNYKSFINKLTDKTGRLILNGVPTGVEVCAAMQHGGPFPATNDNRFTSVGATAIYRFVRPVAWQDWEQQLLPDELKEENPLGIFRLTDNKWTK